MSEANDARLRLASAAGGAPRPEGPQWGGARSAHQVRERARRAFDLAAVLVVLFKVLATWLVLRSQHPDAPLSGLYMYRPGGDIEYFPMIASVSRLESGEFVLADFHGEGHTSFPWSIVVFHALWFRLLGAGGLVLADALFALAHYFVLASVFRKLGLSWGKGRALALFFLCCGSELTQFSGEATYGKLHLMPILDWRIARPFVTQLFALLAVSKLLDIRGLSPEEDGRRAWAGLGVFLALLFPGDPFATIGLLLAAAFLGALFLAARHARAASVFSLALAAFFFLGLASPTFVQRLGESPDYLRRLGVFPVSRSAPLFGRPSCFLHAGAAVLAFVLARIAVGKLGGAKSSGKLESCRVLVLCTISAFLALPLSCVLFGKTVQIYHFYDTLTRFSSLTVIVVALHVLQALRVRLAIPERRGRVLPLLSVLSLCVFASLSDARENARREYFREDAQVRDFASLPTYREDFLELTHELSKHDHRGDFWSCEVLGTLDVQVFSWWVAFRHGKSAIAEGCMTTVPDQEVERRLTGFLKMLGMTKEACRSFLDRFYVDAFWLGTDKYQASRAHTFAPLEDYTDEQRARIAASSIDDAWLLIVPPREMERILSSWEATSVERESARPDIVVLTKDPVLASLEPPGRAFALAFENATFRVWIKR